MQAFEPYSPPTEISDVQIPRFTTIILSSMLLLGGIGGGWSVTGTGETGMTVPIVVRPFVSDEAEAELEFDPAIHRQNLTKIREFLGLNMTEMAQVFCVSRTALYGWFKGITPHTKQMKRINEVFSFAELAVTYQIPRMELLKNVPLSRGKTLLQTVATNDDVPGALAEIRDMALARKVAKETRLSRIAGKDKILGAEDFTPAFSTFE